MVQCSFLRKFISLSGLLICSVEGNFSLFVYLSWTVLGLHCCMGFPLVLASGGYSLVAVCRVLIMVASLAAEHGLSGALASVVVEHRLSCPMACVFFPDQG